MQLLRFSMTILRREYTKSIFYGLTLLFGVALSFLFFNIINNEYLSPPQHMTSGAGFSDVNIPLSIGISFLVICFCCFMILFASNFYLSRKKKEFALLATSGMSTMQITLYTVYQMLVVLVITIPFGLLLGAIIVPAFNYYMYPYLNVTASIFYIPLAAIGQTFITIVVMIILIVMVTSGYIYRNDIQTLLSENKKMNGIVIKEGYKTALLSSLYIFGIVMMFMADHSASVYVFPTLIGMVGAAQILKQGFAKWSRRCKKSSWIASKVALICSSNLSSALQQSATLLYTMIIAVTVMVSVLTSQQDNIKEFVTATVAYIVIIVLLVTSIVYKVCMDNEGRKDMFFNLWKIGYTKGVLKKIIKREISYFYLMALLLPMPYIVVISIRFIMFEQVSVLFLILIVLAYMIPIIISSGITYRSYCKVALTFNGGN